MTTSASLAKYCSAGWHEAPDLLAQDKLKLPTTCGPSRGSELDLVPILEWALS